LDQAEPIGVAVEARGLAVQGQAPRPGELRPKALGVARGLDVEVGHLCGVAPGLRFVGARK
jgi:hypothetical protein